MTREDEIRAREQAATPGPWSGDDEHGLIEGSVPAWVVSQSDDEGKYLGDLAWIPQGLPNEENDALFMAHARQDIPYLLDKVANQERHIALLRSMLAAEQGKDALDRFITYVQTDSVDRTSEAKLEEKADRLEQQVKDAAKKLKTIGQTDCSGMITSKTPIPEEIARRLNDA